MSLKVKREVVQRVNQGQSRPPGVVHHTFEINPVEALSRVINRQNPPFYDASNPFQK